MSASPAVRSPETTVSLSTLFKQDVVDANDERSGRFVDAVIKLRNDRYPLLIGLVIEQHGNRLFAPASAVMRLDDDAVRLRIAAAELQAFAPRDGDVLVKQDVLGRRLIDIGRRALVRAYDIRIADTPEGWAVVGLDVHRHRWFRFGTHQRHSARDWHGFLLLTGDQKLLKTRSAANWIGRLKPAQIADIIEGASAQEQSLLLAQVHADPDLEADVFEELDEDRQAQLFRIRSDQEIADVLSRMRADDVADAVMDLPQDRRRKVLDLLPQSQNKKVLNLLGYHEATAGGLMGTDYLALSEDHSIADALQRLRAAITQQPEALTTIHSLHADGTLAGTLGLVRALQMDPGTLLRDAADPDTIVAAPDNDVITVTTRMADYNLLSLPVLDPTGRILGIITVDDALEAAIPRDWFRRGQGQSAPRVRPPERSLSQPDSPAAGHRAPGEDGEHAASGS